MSPMLRTVRSLGRAVVLVLFASACAATPRFPPVVQTSLARHDMRRMETDSLVLYYPEGREDLARRFAGRVERCVGTLRLRATDRSHRGRLYVVMPEIPFNNAYVFPGGAGIPLHMVVPVSFTYGGFAELGMPVDPGFIACHEAVHYVQAEQLRGLAWFLDAVFGPTLNPQSGLDPWFWEGLATYYESQLVPGAGRMASPAFRQTFASGMATTRMTGGTMSLFRRGIPHGAQYLVGAHFVEYLILRYGEDRLWTFIDLQAQSWLPPFRVSGRFESVYGRSLSELVDEFAAWVKQVYPPRARPPGQRRLEGAGRSALYTRGPDGSEALYTADLDELPRLVVRGPDGRVRLERKLPDLLPPRQILIGMIEGLSFSADGRYLYFTSFDLTSSDMATRLLRLDVDHDELDVIHGDVRGTGGVLTPDGRRYLYPRADGDHHDLAEIDVATGRLRVVQRMPVGTILSNPDISPDGRRLVAMVSRGNTFEIWVLSADTGELISRLTKGGPSSYDPSWVDDRRVVYLAERETRLRPVIVDVATGAPTEVVAVPYVARTPRAHGGTLRFLNREGWTWTLDEVALPALATAEPATQPATAAAATRPAAEPAPPVRVHTDEPYSQLDGLFYPETRVPFLSTASGDTHVGLLVGGSDRLGFHTWSLQLDYGTRAGELSGQAMYWNALLAPWLIGVSAGQRTLAQPVDPDVEDSPEEVLRYRAGNLLVARSFWDIPFVVGGTALEIRTEEPTFVETRRFAGATGSVGWAAGRGTPYGGTRELVGLDVSGGFYPSAWGSAFTLGDTAGTVRLAVPVPFTRRARLGLRGRGRALLNVPDGTELLQIGGVSAFVTPYSSRTQTTQGVSDVLPDSVTFVEPLRGYEDLGFVDNRVLIGEATARYNVPLDVGTASTLWLLPAFFARDLVLEAFASGALVHRDKRHLAVGASVSLELSLWTVPFSLGYQLTRRLTDDDALVHLAGVSLGMTPF